MFAPDKVTVPAPVLLTPAVPPRIALTVPACRSNTVALVSTPVVPLMLPLVSCTPFTVSPNPATFTAPPETTTFAVSTSWLACCHTAEPPNTVRLPPSAFAPVVFRFSVPALTVVSPL